jgi:hypothetical protein
LTRASMAATEMPTSRNGNAMSHTSGNKTNNVNASGQDKTNKTHQITRRARSFTYNLAEETAILIATHYRQKRFEATDLRIRLVSMPLEIPALPEHSP